MLVAKSPEVFVPKEAANPFKGGGDQTQIKTKMEGQKRHKKPACFEEHSYFSFVWHI